MMNLANDLEDLVIAEVLQRWPKTAEIFNQYNTACVGCPISEYCTMATAVEAYGLDGPSFLADMKKTIENA